MSYRFNIQQGCELAMAEPAPALRPGVRHYRGYQLCLGAVRRRLEVPEGAVTLVLGFEHRIWITAVGQGEVPPSRTSWGSLVSSLCTHARIGEHNGNLHGIEIVLQPWAAYTLFGVPMSQWVERLVDPDDLAGARVSRLTSALAATAGWARRFELLDSALALWSAQGPAASPQVVWAWREISRTGGTIPIRRLAEQTGWSWRQFDNRFRQQIGLPAKSAARIMRLQRVLQMLSGDHAQAHAAITAGFCDQAHMSREIRAMTGLTPSGLLAIRRQAGTGPLFHDRLTGEVTSFFLR